VRGVATPRRRPVSAAGAAAGAFGWARATVGAALSIGLAATQFDSWGRVLLVAAIFLAGQTIEGNVLTPKLVGDRVHLHPVWLMFAVLAFGALFGFLGILVAVPVAAAMGVLVRYWLSRYLESDLYDPRPT